MDNNIKQYENGGNQIDFDAAEPGAIRCVPYETARKYNILPLRLADGKLHVAMQEPVNVLAVDDLRFITKKHIVPVAASAAVIASKIEAAYSDRYPAQAAAAQTMAQAARSAATHATHATQTHAAARGLADDADDDIGAAPAVRLANSILNQSVAMKASDIHLEPFEDCVRVRYRIDGSLTEAAAIPTELYSAVSTRIKIIAGMDIAERRLPQDGRVEMEIAGGVYDFRVSSLPTVFGEKIEIRKLDRSGFSFDRRMLSFTERENRLIDSSVLSPRGIVLVTGPTGSGKTTTIYSLLSELNSVDKNIVTIEDPVEYMIRGISQVQVNAKAGLTFAGGLRSILRQDPDIIMIGEIRDEETAEIAVRAAITGHLVLSTLHTNDATGSIARLMDMGIPPYLIGEAVTCVIAQRLVRRLCDDCKAERDATPPELSALNQDKPARVFDPVGCPKCNQIGYRGRRAIHELFYLDGDMKRRVERSGGGTEGLREAAVAAGMTTLYDDCRGLVLQGLTSMRELVNTVYAGG